MSIDLPLAVDIYIGAVLFLLGAVMGSFITCAADRYCRHESVLKGRSKCDNCGATLSALDLVPILSYIFLGGKCRHCGAKIPPRCLVVEVVTACLYAGTYALLGCSAATFEYILLFSALIAVALIDIDTMEIPNGLLIFAAMVFVAFLYSHGSGTADMLDRLKDGFAGAVIYGGGMLVISLFMDEVLGRESMGGGDIKLFAVLGLFTGLIRGLLMLLVSSVVGIIASVSTGTNKEGFPFGPAIAEAAIFTLLFGQYIVDQYMALIFV